MAERNKRKTVINLAIIAAIAAPVWEGTQWLLLYLERQADNKTAIQRVIEGKLAINRALWKVESGTRARRALVYKGHDGGKPQIDRPFYSSVAEEAHDPLLLPMSLQWQSQKLDFAYLEVLIQVYQSDEVRLVTSELRQGILKDSYEVMGTQMSLMYRIHETSQEFLYYAITFPEVVDLTPVERDIIRTSVSELRLLYSQKRSAK